jgi:hypothetical protein
LPWFVLISIIALAGLLPATAQAATSVNARAYGMVGDNVTDNSRALLRACRAGRARHLPVMIPAGRYRLASTVAIPAGVTLQGAGGVSDVRTDGSFKGTWLRGHIRFESNSTFKNMKIGDIGPGATVTMNGYRASNVRFTNVRFRGGDPDSSSPPALFVVNCPYSLRGLYITKCQFERNFGRWSSNGSAGGFNVAADTADGDVIENIWVRGCHFGVSNGVRKGQPTFNIVFWQSEEGGSGYWSDVHIIDNVFETTDEFNLDFDGLMARDNGKNVVIIRGNLIKGGGKVHADGSEPWWGYTICTEPTRNGTIIEHNVLWRGCFNTFKTTKGTTDTIFRDNVIDMRVDNGVSLIYPDFERTINLYDGARNRVTGNTIYLPAGSSVSSEVIYKAEPTSVVSGNTIKKK